VIITKVIPIAIIPIKEKFLVILNKLSLLEKASSTKYITKQIPSNATETQKDCSDKSFCINVFSVLEINS
jgi:hypothetical protein